MPDIQIWTGRAHRLLGPVIQAIGEAHGQGESCLLLVPEQFTLQAERELLTRLHLDGFFTIDVLSPSRLGERVLTAAGHDQREPLDGPGRQMAVSRALERCEGKLRYYQGSVHRRGFVEKLTALLTDMKQGGLTPEALRQYAGTLSEGVEKLEDIATLYEAYEQLLLARFSDGEDRMRYVAARLPKSGLADGKHVFVYGFDTLPESLSHILQTIAPLCHRLVVSLVCDGDAAPDGELYLPVRQGIARFSALLAQQGLDVKVKPLTEESLPSALAIRHLDDVLYAYPASMFAGTQSNVFLSQHQSPFEEATFIARHIMRLCEEGMDIERIAVLYPDQNGYAFAVAAALGDSGLPFYTDQKLPATTHGLIRFLLAALRAMANGYRNEDMLAMLKSGYGPLAFEDACTLQNYALSFGIDRGRWAKPFTKGEPEYRDACEALRQRLMNPLLAAREAIVDARHTHASLSAVFTLLEAVGAYDTLKAEEQLLLQESLTVRANQNSQVWAAVLRTLDQLYALCDGARVPLKHIATRLECGFGAVSLASLPPSSHMLHAGQLGHFLSGEMDAVFLLGLNDGVLTRHTHSLLSQEERAQAQEGTGAYLGLTDKSRTLFARLDVKQAMTLPRQFLFLSYAKTAPDGTALRPLPLLNTLKNRILGPLQESPVPQEALPLSSSQALAELSLRLRAYGDGMGGESALPAHWQLVLSKLLGSPATAPKAMALLRALGQQPGTTPLPPADARALFGDETLSVSRLERFADCPFKHFVEYGLRPQILKEWKIEPLDTGNFYHESLHNFSKLALEDNAFPHIAPEQAEAMADAAIAPLIENLMEGPMGDGAQSQAAFDRARQTIRRAAVTITRHLAAGQFELAQTEATFGYPGGMPPIVLTLPDGSEVMLRGKIDRIDRYQDGGSLYLRVIDYKSSRQNLEAARTWWGLQLQLLLYLDACVAAQPGALPAGAFYFYVADPLVESDTDLKATAEDKLRQLLQLRGIALADVEVIRAMDSPEASVALPPMLDKEGDVKRSAQALTLPELQALLQHSRQVAAHLAHGIFSGQTDIAPVKEKDRSACDYCHFAPICRFDPNGDETGYRQLPAMDMDALRQQLSEGEASM